MYPEGWSRVAVIRHDSRGACEGNPNNLVASIKNAIHQIDPDRPVLDVKTMEDVVAESLTPQRSNMLLLAAFAGLALLLAAVGIYSVLAYAVRQPSARDRPAHGTGRPDRRRSTPDGGGRHEANDDWTGNGILGALALGRVLSGMIFGVSTRDVATYASVSVLLVGAALFASLIPAWRATKVDPIHSLHDE